MLADLILNNSEKEIIQALDSDLNLNVNESDHFGFRPLIEAIFAKKFLVFEKLINHPKINIEQQDLIGRSPLQWAVERGEIKFVKRLLEKNANPNHYALDGQPLIAQPLLRGENELINLLVNHGANIQFGHDYIHAKLLAHRFELTGKGDIVTPKETFIPIDLEGFYLEFTCGLMQKSLEGFLDKTSNQIQPKIKAIMRTLKRAAHLLEYTRHKDIVPFEKNIDHLIEQEDLLIIPFGYRGHAVSFIKYRDLFAKCDRGVKNIVDTTVISKLGNPYRLTKQFIKELIYQSKPAQFIDYELKNYLKLSPINTLPTESQIAGNCSWANIEATVPAILFMLLWQHDYAQTFKTEPIKQQVMDFYRNWVEWDKDTAINETLDKFYNAENKSPRQLSFAFLLTQVLVQRLSAKNTQHIERAKKILRALTSQESGVKFILSNVRQIYNKKSALDAGTNVKSLLAACGFDLKDLVYINHT